MIKRWEQPQQWGGCYWEYCDKWRRDMTDITCHDGHDCHAIIIASAPGLHGITISILTKWYRSARDYGFFYTWRMMSECLRIATNTEKKWSTCWAWPRCIIIDVLSTMMVKYLASYQLYKCLNILAKCIRRVSQYPGAPPCPNQSKCGTFFQNVRFMPQFAEVKVRCYRSCNNKQIKNSR